MFMAILFYSQLIPGNLKFIVSLCRPRRGEKAAVDGSAIAVWVIATT